MRVKGNGQPSLFVDGEWATAEGEESVCCEGSEGIRYDDPSPEGILIGLESLRDYLQERGLEEVIRLRELLRSLDWSEFEERYSRAGRPGYHPAAMVGLIVLGLMQGRSSLRGIEELARSDVRAWWVSGGVQPDHSAIGHFIRQHEGSLSGEFFEEVTRELIGRVGGGKGRLAGDGTLVQAAASSYRRLSVEAAQAAAEQAEKEAAQAVAEDKEEAQRRAQHKRQVAEVARERQSNRRRYGRSGEIRVSPGEPEAAILRKGAGRAKPSYQPTVLADEKRMVVGQAVATTSEKAVLAELVEQAMRTQGEVKELLLDGGYHDGQLARRMLEQGVENILCPSGRAVGDGPWEKDQGGGPFSRRHFHYDSEQDLYECPAGQQLRPLKRGRERGQPYVLYGGPACQQCEFKQQCTRSPSGRRIRRLQGEDYAEAMKEVLRDQRAQQVYRKRKCMVEPVFSELKCIQGLRRFRRRGLSAVRVEFALHCLTYNLRRFLALTRANPEPQNRFCGLFDWLFRPLWLEKLRYCAA